jgi:hypothetical protein
MNDLKLTYQLQRLFTVDWYKRWIACCERDRSGLFWDSSADTDENNEGHLCHVRDSNWGTPEYKSSITKVWRSRGIALQSLNFGTMAVSGQLHATSALPPPPVEMVASTLCWGGFGESEWRSGRFGEEKSRMEPRSHVSTARSCRCGVATVFKVMKPWSSVKLKAAEFLLLTTNSHRNHAECAIVWFRFFFSCIAYLRVTAHLRYSLCTTEECSTGLVRFQAGELGIRGGQAMCMLNGVYVLSSSVKLLRVWFPYITVPWSNCSIAN